jgi:hypothetical protein
MNTVLFPQPLIDPTTSTVQLIAIQISINRSRTQLDSFIQPVEECECELCDKFFKHFTSIILLGCYHRPYLLRPLPG